MRKKCKTEENDLKYTEEVIDGPQTEWTGWSLRSKKLIPKNT